jgi:hypothetical protein
MIGIFIDGPLAGEVMPIHEPSPTYYAPLPARETICDCIHEDGDIVAEHPAETFTYYRILIGSNIAIYSKESNDEQILHSLKNWIITDLSSTKRWSFNCRDRRAWS